MASIFTITLACVRNWSHLSTELNLGTQFELEQVIWQYWAENENSRKTGRSHSVSYQEIYHPPCCARFLGKLSSSLYFYFSRLNEQQLFNRGHWKRWSTNHERQCGLLTNHSKGRNKRGMNKIKNLSYITHGTFLRDSLLEGSLVRSPQNKDSFPAIEDVC